jgi:hypothetical protein
MTTPQVSKCRAKWAEWQAQWDALSKELNATDEAISRLNPILESPLAVYDAAFELRVQRALEVEYNKRARLRAEKARLEDRAPSCIPATGAPII